MSDHYHLVLKVEGWDSEPKPFWFNNHWLENQDFQKVVGEGWKNQNVRWCMSFVLKRKLKSLKSVFG